MAEPPLGAVVPGGAFRLLRVKIRDDAMVRNKAVYLALGIQPDGTRDVLGLCIEQSEGASTISNPRPLVAYRTP